MGSNAYFRGFIIQYATFKKRETAARESSLDKDVNIAEVNYKLNMSEENLRKLPYPEVGQ